MSEITNSIRLALERRFGERFTIDPGLPGLDEIFRIATHRVCRKYSDKKISSELLRLLCACALSAPSKSDLQQADILVMRELKNREAIAALLPEMPWIAAAPVFILFLADARRLEKLFRSRGRPFPNDHLDLFFNATVDAAIVLSQFIRAVEAVGLGCCPISVIRNHAEKVSALAGLPEKVIPIAGMCVGWPAEEGGISPRLPLTVTLHEETFADKDVLKEIENYDRRRAGLQPYRKQREIEGWEPAEFYGWSEDKVRQYSTPQRTDFGAFVQAKKFNLD